MTRFLIFSPKTMSSFFLIILPCHGLLRSYHAKHQLNELKEISVLEEQRTESFKIFQNELNTLSQIISVRNSNSNLIGFEEDNLEYNPSVSDGINECQTVIKEFNQFSHTLQESQNDLEKYDKLIETHNLSAESENKSKAEVDLKLQRLKIISDKIRSAQTRTEAIEKNLKVWNKSIEDFNTDNATLIKEVESEKAVVEQNIAFSTAYTKFIKNLNEYNEQLPLKHLEDLNNLTLEIYNIINSHDKDFEVISKIILPTTTDGIIGVCFTNEPGKIYDALQILSEGHIRCLGLSILLAKNIHDNCPVIIFDDIVNAIDSDHQGGIRKVIFEYEPIAIKQIILTTHSEPFIKELEQHPSKKEYSKLVDKISLTQDENERKIRIKLNGYKNYLILASQYFNDAEYSEALYNCRCALENISNKIWNMIGSKGFKTDFNVLIRSPKSPPDLMSVVLAISKFIKTKDVDEKLKSLDSNIDYMIGLEENGNVIWSYLNKGTHEEEGKPNFDPLMIKEIIENLNEIDEKFKKKE